jgi:hypothetical protein
VVSFNQIYILDVEITELEDGLKLEKESLDQYLKLQLAFNVDCQQYSGQGDDLTSELLTFEIINEPSDVSYEIITGDLSCDGLEATISLVNSTGLAAPYFNASYLQINQTSSYHFISKNISPALKMADSTLLIDLSDWTFNADAELDPEEECPTKLDLEFDSLNLQVGKEKVLDIGGFQYSPSSASEVNNGLIQCNTNWTYTVEMVSPEQDTLVPFIRHNNKY